MNLDIDAGNTRIKWRLSKDGALVDRGVVDGLAGLGTAVDVTAARIDRVRVASVRDDAFDNALMDLARTGWGAEAEFAVVSASCAGVVNAYEDPSRMGIDRWLAMLAAFNDTGGHCCVVDCGSAITVDLVADDGRHEGGYIVPGLSMQRAMLGKSTGRIILSDSPDWTSLGPGIGTEAAVSHGVLLMVVTWLAHDERVRQASRQGSLLLTGGDVHVLAPWLAAEGLHWREPADLVLDGLQYSLP